VFINYRGVDSGSNSFLLYRELSSRFGPDLVFRDAESIPAGADYVAELLRRVRQARVVLAVIGPQWLTVTDDRGRRLIDNPADWIRRELAEAFAAGVPVIPVLTDGAQMPTKADLPADIAALARCQYRWLRHRDAPADLARIVTDCAGVLGGNAPGPRLPDQAGTPRAGPDHEAAASRVRGPLGKRALALWAVLGFCGVAVVAVVAVAAFLRAGSHPQATPTSPSTTEPTPNPPQRTEPPATPSSPQPTRTTQAEPEPTGSLPHKSAASLSEGLGIDFESGSVGMAFSLAGVDISIGPGIDSGMVDVGDGAAIYETERKPTRPADCYDGPATSSVPLPLRTGHHLCVLTGNGQLATLDVTASTRGTLRFIYWLWPRT
jgi:hypothetical protein